MTRSGPVRLAKIGVDTLQNSANLEPPQTWTRFPIPRTITMVFDAPENKKRKVSPEPDAGIAPASNLLIKRLSEKAKLPTRGSALAAGYDLYR